MYWSYQMSYMDIVSAFKELEKSGEPISLYHLRCLDRSLRQDQKTQILFDRFCVIPREIRIQISQIIARNRTQNLDTHSKIFSGPRNKTQEWINALSPPHTNNEQKKEHYIQIINTITQRIQSGEFDSLLINAEISRIHEREREKETKNVVHNETLTSVNQEENRFFLRQKMVEYLERQKKLARDGATFSINLLCQTEKWIGSLTQDQQERAWQSVVMAFDDSRNAYHASPVKYLADLDDSCPKGAEERLLDMLTVWRLELNPEPHTSSIPALQIVEPYISEGVYLCASDALYTSYCKAAGYTLVEKERYVYEIPVFQRESQAYQNSLKQWKEDQEKQSSILERKAQRNSVYWMLHRQWKNSVTEDSQDNFEIWCAKNQKWEEAFESQILGIARIGRDLSPTELEWGFSELLGTRNSIKESQLQEPKIRFTEEQIIEKMIEQGAFFNKDHAKLIFSVLPSGVAELYERAQCGETFKSDADIILSTDLRRRLEEDFRTDGFWWMVPEGDFFLVSLVQRSNGRFKILCSQDVFLDVIDKNDLDRNVIPNGTLEMIIQSGYAKVLKRFIEIPTNHTVATYKKALILSLKYSQVDCLRVLIPQHDDSLREQIFLFLNLLLNPQDDYVFQLEELDVDILIFLEKIGINLTALMWACIKKNYNDKLIAFVNVKDQYGRTALMHTIICGNMAGSEVFIQAGSDLDIKDEDGKTALMFASMYGAKETIQALVKAGVNLNNTDQDGHTALMLAISLNQTEAVKALIAAGADYNIRDKNGETALVYAMNLEHIEAAEVLIAAGADFNQSNQDLTNFLFKAAEFGSLCIIQNLLSSGANPTAFTEDGLSIIEIFLMSVLAGQAKRSLEHEDLENHENNNNTAVLVALLEAIRNYDEHKVPCGPIGLMLAAVFDRAWLQELIKAGVDIYDIENKSPIGSNVVRLAVSQGQFKSVKIFLDAGHDPFDKYIHPEYDDSSELSEAYRNLIASIEDSQILHGNNVRSHLTQEQISQDCEDLIADIERSQVFHENIVLDILCGKLDLTKTPCPESRLLMILKNDIDQQRFLSSRFENKKSEVLASIQEPNSQVVQSALLFQAIEHGYSRIMKRYTAEQLNEYINANGDLCLQQLVRVM